MRRAIVHTAFALCGLSAIAQPGTRSNASTNQPAPAMDTSALTEPTVKAAFDAWQDGNASAFLALFAKDATLTDDGSPRDLQRFVREACGKERFTSIGKVANGGKDIHGHFHTESWGDFNTYFKFHLGAGGKITRLDIGQDH